MTSPTTSARIKDVSLSTGGTTVTIALSCTTVPAARELFGDLRRAHAAGELVTALNAQSAAQDVGP